jgi:hypothetical protein
VAFSLHMAVGNNFLTLVCVQVKGVWCQHNNKILCGETLCWGIGRATHQLHLQRYNRCQGWRRAVPCSCARGAAGDAGAASMLFLQCLYATLADHLSVGPALAWVRPEQGNCVFSKLPGRTAVLGLLSVVACWADGSGQESREAQVGQNRSW